MIHICVRRQEKRKLESFCYLVINTTTSHGYNRLWKLLIDRGMTRTQMRLAAGISTSTLAKLSKGEDVNSSILVKICDALQCNIGDIADCVPNAKEQTLGAGA